MRFRRRTPVLVFVCLLSSALPAQAGFFGRRNTSNCRSVHYNANPCCNVVTIGANTGKPALEPIVEQLQESYTVQVPIIEMENGKQVLRYRAETRTRTVIREYRTAEDQITYLKRALGLLETQKVDPLAKRVTDVETKLP